MSWKNLTKEQREWIYCLLLTRSQDDEYSKYNKDSLTAIQKNLKK